MCNYLDYKNTKNGTERDGPFVYKEHQERNGTERGWNDWKKNKRERNDLAGGPIVLEGN